jgi:hypothetical protein
MNLTFMGPCIADIFPSITNKDATSHNLFISVKCSTFFRRYLRPSSGAQKLYIQHRVLVKALLLPAALVEERWIFKYNSGYTIPHSTNKCTVLLLRISLLISCYMFRLNCRYQGAYSYITKTYSNKIILQCLGISNVQFVFEIQSVWSVMTILCIVECNCNKTEVALTLIWI